MPITQERMIALILSARDYQDALGLTQQIILQRAEEAMIPAVRSALRDLAEELRPIGLLRDPEISPSTILIEETHFRTQGNRNVQSAKRQAIKRGDGKPPGKRHENLGQLYEHTRQIIPKRRINAPDTIARSGQYIGSIRDVIQQEISGTKPPANTAPGLYDPPEEESSESIGIGRGLGVEARAAIDEEIRQEQEADRLAQMAARKPAPKPD